MTNTLHKWTLIVIILSACCEGKATVLYVRFSSNEIVIGTDSKRTAETGDTVCVCKLIRIGDTFVASAGLAEYGAFDPREFAKEALTTSRTLVESRTKFEQLIEQPLIEVLKRLKTKNRDRYEVFKRGAAINIVFARFNDQPELVASALTPRDARDGSIILDKHPITLIGDVKRAQRIAVGVSNRAKVLLDRPSFWANGTVAGVQRILQISIEDNTEAGEPIDIVQLTKGGVRWFPREPECDQKSRRINDQRPTCNSSKH
jgi:hypothetical protein